ncbi:hypothetical protein PENTCL1PPCAC_16205, partial [Pristionchus entomophagus]
MIFVFLGPCSLISQDLCRFCQGLHINLVQHSAIVLLLSFAFRLYILGSDVFSNRRVPSPSLIWIICLSSLALMAVPIIAYYVVQTEVTPEVLKRFRLEGYMATNYNIFGGTAEILLDALGCCLSPIVMTLIFIVRRTLIKRIAKAV